MENQRRTTAGTSENNALALEVMLLEKKAQKTMQTGKT
jgi:hypothetical protein